MSSNRRIEDFLVQSAGDGAQEYREILTRKLFHVNAELLKSSRGYKATIGIIVQYFKDVLEMKFSNYPTLLGVSGANLGIPFNIIGINKRSGKTCTETLIMVNPRIVDRSRRTIDVRSNCGSVRLKEPIRVSRNVWVEVEYYSEKGVIAIKKFSGLVARTIQHEVDHNNGILITDYEE